MSDVDPYNARMLSSEESDAPWPETGEGSGPFGKIYGTWAKNGRPVGEQRIASGSY